MTEHAGGPVSPHPVDRLIRELVRTRRSASTEELAHIIARMSAAPFDPRERSVPVGERELDYLGRRLGARQPTLFYHLVKRVRVERQWAEGTTAARYLGDLRRAVRDPQARLAVYERRGGIMSVTLTPTTLVVPVERQGAAAESFLLVVYAADRGTIVSGYQVSGLETAGIPREALWLR